MGYAITDSNLSKEAFMPSDKAKEKGKGLDKSEKEKVSKGDSARIDALELRVAALESASAPVETPVTPV